MANREFTSPSVTANDKSFKGGLNSTAGNLGLNNTESSDLQNIDFDKFGSISKRNGYTALNTSAVTNTPNGDGLHWFEYDVSGTTTRKAILVADGKLWKMDDLDGTWDDITGGLTITADNLCDFENWNNKVFVTNGEDPPFEWDGTTAQAIQNTPTNLTDSKYVAQFNNYLFLANVIVNSVKHGSRIYWSDINNEGAWTDTNFINIANDDGQEITGIKVLSDRLVVYKTRSIYNVFFTGDTTIPFILPGGGKSNSAVGCVAPFSIQELENGHVFLSTDGFYFYDGNNSFKISDKITTTLLGYNTAKFGQAVSLVQKDKNRYWCSLSSSGQTTNDRVLVWDYFNNAWSIYTGIAAASMATFYVSGIEERPYFFDYSGFGYRADTGLDDYILNVQTAIDAYYWTNWRDYDDLVSQKGIPQAVIYYQISSSTLVFDYSYDGETGSSFSQSVDISTSDDQYDTALYDTATYATTGGSFKPVNLIGRGRLVRFKFSNSTLAETFTIDGLGAYPHLETNK